MTARHAALLVALASIWGASYPSKDAKPAAKKAEKAA